MAHGNSPALALVVAANTTTYPKANDIRGSTTATDSPFISTQLILESMTCLVIAGAGNIVISNHAADATNSFTVTTTAACTAGTQILFGAQGIAIGKGLKVVAAASTGTWLYSFREA